MMNPFPDSSRARGLWLVVIFVVAWASSATGQDRRDTGRHRPEPVVTKDPEESDIAPETSPMVGTQRWHMGLAGGMQGGGDLFRVETLDGLSQTWQGVGGTTFNSPRFTATFDQDLSLALQIWRDLGARTAVRLDLGFSRMDIAAEALTGQIGVLYRYDRFKVFNVGLGVDFRLTGAASYPFGSVTALISRLTPATFTELGQTNLGGRLALGYHQVVSPQVALRFEARMTATAFSVGDFRPPTSPASIPEIRFESEENIQFFEIMIGVRTSFGP